MPKLILRNCLSPGDVVMLTAAVRDLHRTRPGRFLTDVRTACPAIWENNPLITPLDESDPDVRLIDCHYPIIHRSNQAPYHFIHGYVEDLATQLRIPGLRCTEFKGDIHLSTEEMTGPSPVAQHFGDERPYWIVCAGGKYDYTIKWWHFRRYQRVVDHFLGRLQFVQVGESGHFHPPLKNVLDLRGQTSLRQIIHLMYHARGVLCGVTLLMHLAAAVPCRPDHPAARPAVIIAGGREPPHWEAYPSHQFLHTVGSLPCCATGGCWRARTLPLGDGDDKDDPKHLCLDVVRGLPHCMDLITPEDVATRIEWTLARRFPTNHSRKIGG